ncbi:MAG: 50S ribosomal protein L23 [Patescibacteria group bacterium]
MTAKPTVILSRHETEKAAGQQAGVYTFRVGPTANKTEIKKEIVKSYQVKPRQLRIINIPRKRFIYRGHPAWKSGYKKVLVYLRAGDKIDFKK